MARRRKPIEESGTPEGIAGGPGPTPPGIDDGTPKVAPSVISPPLQGLPQAEIQRRAGEIAEREAGERVEDVPEIEHDIEEARERRERAEAEAERAHRRE